MSINCCKSYVGKQIIGLLPGDGEPPVEQKCLYIGSWTYEGMGPYSPTYITPPNGPEIIPAPNILIYNIGINAYANGYDAFGFFPVQFYAQIWTVATSQPVGWKGKFIDTFFGIDTLVDINWSEPQCDSSLWDTPTCWIVSGTYDTSVQPELYLQLLEIPNLNAYGPNNYALNIFSSQFKNFLYGIFGSNAQVTILTDGISNWSIELLYIPAFLAPSNIEVQNASTFDSQTFGQISC